MPLPTEEPTTADYLMEREEKDRLQKLRKFVQNAPRRADYPDPSQWHEVVRQYRQAQEQLRALESEARLRALQ